MRVCLYSRVSTIEQKKGASLSEQLAFLKDYCKQNKHQIVAEFKDAGFTGTNDKRPDFKRMISGIEKGTLKVEAVLVRSSDRWFRNHVGDSQYRDRLEEKNVVVISTDRPAPNPKGDSPAEWYGQSIMALNDEMYSRMVSFHTRKGMLASAKTNQFLGGKIPFGYRVITGDKGKPFLDKDPSQSNTVLLIFDLYVRKRFTSSQVVKELRRLAVTDQQGKHFTMQRIHYILSNETYIGRRVYNRKTNHGKKTQDKSEWIYQDVPAIIETAVFETAQEIKKQRTPNRAYTGTTPNAQYVLSDLCFCKACGAKMIHRTAKGGKYEYYECSNSAKGTKASCNAGTRQPVALLDDSVIDVIGLRLFGSVRFVGLIREMHLMRHNAENKLEDLKRRGTDLDRDLQTLFKELTLGDIPRETLLPEIQRRSNEKADLEDEIRRLEALRKVPQEVYDIDSMINTVGKIWKWVKDKTEPKRGNALLKLFIQRIEVNGNEVLIKAHPDSVQKAFFAKKGEFLVSNKDGAPNKNRTCV